MGSERLITGKYSLLLLCAVILFISCCNPYEQSKNERMQKARAGKGDVVVAVVWPRFQPPTLFREGVALAVRQINETGGILGRRLRTINFDDTDNPGEYFDAEKIADNTNIVAVVGHYHSDSTLSALITYEYHGILLLIAAASHPILLEQGFEYVFRAAPNDRVYGEHLARYAHGKGYKRVAIIDNSTFYGTGLADIFYQKATDLGLQIVIHRGYLPWQDDFRSMIAQLQKMEFDVVFLSGILPQAATLIRQLRQMGISAPIIAGDGLDAQELIAIAGEAANGTVVPTMSPLLPSDPAHLNFMNAFREVYDNPPDQYASLGYDTIHLLNAMMTDSGTSVPIVVASALRHTQGWKGVLGEYLFAENGELSQRNIFFKQVQDGKFVTIKE